MAKSFLGSRAWLSLLAVVVGAAVVCSAAALAGSAGPPSKLPLAQRTVTFAWAGDTVLGSSYGQLPAGGYPLLEQVAPLFRAADIGWVNLEEAFSNTGATKCGAGSTNCFAFAAPTVDAYTLRRAGISIVNVANNHADDAGPEGRKTTLAALRRAHVGWDGEPGEIRIETVNGVKVAFLGFAPYPWASRLDDIPAAVRLVRRAARQANLVVVAIHAGAEGADQTHVPVGTEYFLGENRGNSRAFARAVIAAGADLVVGSGPHVIRGLQWLDGHLVAYSLGNLAGDHTFNLAGATSLAGVLTVTLTGTGRYVRGHWTSLALEEPGIPVPDRTHAGLHLAEQLSKEDFGKTGARFRPDGTILPPH